MITDNNEINGFSESFELVGKLKRISNYLTSESKKIFTDDSGSIEYNQFLILSLLSGENPLSVKQISSYLKITHPAAVQLLNKLIKKNYVIKYDSTSDKRVTLIKLTDEGKLVFEQLKHSAEKIDKSLREIIDEVDPKFLITLSIIEEKIKAKSINQRVSEKIKEDQIKNIKIVKYKHEYKNIFKSLNLEWLNKYFEVEKEDEKALNNPEEYYLKNGGEIFFALVDNKIVGTCAMKKITKKIFELSKMAVSEEYKGKQIGKKLALTAIGYAFEEKAEKIILETSPKLFAAINLYKKLGFEIVNETLESKYQRTLFKMELYLK